MLTVRLGETSMFHGDGATCGGRSAPNKGQLYRSTWSSSASRREVTRPQVDANSATRRDVNVPRRRCHLWRPQCSQPRTAVSLYLELVGLAQEHYRRVCYYGPVHHVKPNFNDLDLKLCTHIIYGFSKVGDDNTLVAAKPEDEDRYKAFNEHVQRYNKETEASLQVKTLLCVSKGAFPTMVATFENRTTFIQSALKKLNEWGGFGGLDVDWEFPNMRNDHPDDKDNFKDFLQEARREFNKENKMLTVALPTRVKYIEHGFQGPTAKNEVVQSLSESVDFASIMTYDYNVYNEIYRRYVGPNAPLYNWSSNTNKYAMDETRYIEYTAHYWENLGLPKSKTNIGIPLFGRQFELVDEKKHSFLDNATRDKSVRYNWTCNFIRGGATEEYEAKSRTPYAYRNKVWVSFDNEKSIGEKVKWIKDNGYIGAMSYGLTYDDMYGNCSTGKKFPLQSVIYEHMKN
ncbi:acidic mammalian chitinase-like [Ornithodoros turicata]|uniref:acidic mammalian chitinase-like n=1 Tax=Ornithodoros turicata TaxID=34597 RepID=UPI003138EF06